MLSFTTLNTPAGTPVYGVQFVLDQGSGVFRPIYNTDLGAQVSVSGLSVSVNAVSITGAPVVSLTGNQPVNVVNTAPIAISGVVVSQGGSSNGTVAVTGNPQFTVSNPILAVSGVVTTSASASSVAITGNPQVTVSNPILAVSGTFAATTDNTSIVAAQGSGNAYLAAISGSLATNLNTPAWVTGQVSLTAGTFSPTFNVVTGGQVQIPVGVKSASVSIVSGAAWVNGNGPLPAGYSMNLGGYNGTLTLSAVVNVGCTGSAQSPCKAVVIWEV